MTETTIPFFYIRTLRLRLTKILKKFFQNIPRVESQSRTFLFRERLAAGQFFTQTFRVPSTFIVDYYKTPRQNQQASGT